MKLAKRILAAFLVAVMAVSAFVVCASAESIYDTAKEIKSGVTKTVTGINKYGGCIDYKVNVTKKGTLSLDFTVGAKCAKLYVYDSDGNTISCSDYEMISGKISPYSECLYLEYNQATEKIKAKVSYPVTKGTYYIRLRNANDYYHGGDGKVSLTATYPSASVKEAKISYLTLTVNKGNTVNLGAVLSGSGSVSWSSSKSSVASVTCSGKVTAKAKGSAIITAKCGSSNQKIKIIVK